jgi:soluble lytic murein transglycosylase-like protein
MRIPLGNLITSIAATHNIDPSLVGAICWQESRGDPWAFRYEDAFYKRYLQGRRVEHLLGVVPPTGICSLATELRARAMSWGLMQVMGETARELGYDGAFLSELLIPHVGIEYGCRKLRKCLDGANLDTRAALLRYNGGGNKRYDDQVLSILETGEYSRVFNRPYEEVYDRREIRNS